MSTWAFRLVVIGGFVLVVMIFLVGHIPTAVNRGMDAAAVIAIVTGISVGIERSIEAFWSAVGAWKGAAWPMKLVGDSLDGLTASLDKGLDPFFKRCRAVLGDIEAFGASASAEVTAAKSQLDSLEKQIGDLKGSAKDRQQITSYLSAATGAINYLQVACSVTVPGEGADLEQSAINIASYYARHEELAKPEWAGKSEDDPALAARLKSVVDEEAAAVRTAIDADGVAAEEEKRKEFLGGMSFGTKKLTEEQQKAVDAANTEARARRAREEIRGRRDEGLAKVADAATIAQSAATGLSDFLATFTDNPGRRLISVIIGMGAGLVIAAVLGLDLFSAILGTPTGSVRALDMNVGAIWAWLLSFNGGLVVTGLVVGLGSNPTHEVITALQNYKEGKKSENTPNVASTTPVFTHPSAIGSRLRARPSETIVLESLEALRAEPTFGREEPVNVSRTPTLVRFR